MINNVVLMGILEIVVCQSVCGTCVLCYKTVCGVLCNVNVSLQYCIYWYMPVSTRDIKYKCLMLVNSVCAC